MNSFFKHVEDKIKKNIKVKSILIIDNSSLHTKHKSFDVDKYHLKIEIESDYLKSLERIKAQREIMTILSEELKTKIHALEITIK
ncbi:MAG: BolA/IbaG family iron-sulfur metabolism protein [Proteobacteria bacterium]|nr:BolA/IbaG family iron-sulfur metabolism protein [Pseudomonadota bacterium]